MRKLDIYLLTSVLPVFLLAMVFSILIFQLVDLFNNLTQYLTNQAAIKDILKTIVLYMPKAIIYSLPMALLFSVSYSIGTLYSHNELITIFGSGVSIFDFTKSLLVVGLIFSMGSFVFEDMVVLPTLKQKNELTRKLTKQETTLNNSNITIIGERGQVVYSVGYFNDQNQTLSSVLVIIRDKSMNIVRRIDAQWAEWVEDHWVLNKARVFKGVPETGDFSETYTEKYTEDPFVHMLKEKKETFQRKQIKIEEMSFSDAFSAIDSIKAAGLPYKDLETDLFQRFSYALTSFVVILLSSAIGGWFKKNILLASLIISLVLAVGYYIIQMIFSIMAKLGFIPTYMGAFMGFFVALVAGIILYTKARN